MLLMIKYHRNRTDFNRNERSLVVDEDSEEMAERNFINKYSDAIIHCIEKVD